MKRLTVMDAITVAVNIEYAAPTNRTGSRLRVWRSDCTFREDPDSIYVTWDAEHDAKLNAAIALDRYIDNKAALSEDGTVPAWEGTWHLAWAGSGKWVGVKEGKQEF